MRFLLVSGPGPSYLNLRGFEGTLFDRDVTPALAAAYERLAGRPVDIRRFRVAAGHDPLLRPYVGVAPHLPTATVRSILEASDIDYEWVSTEGIWLGTADVPRGDFDVVGLSTTFIWDAGTLAKAIGWISTHYPGAKIVLGGQYSNLKYANILAAHPEVDFVIRGDAEFGLPRLLAAIDGRGDIADVPNLTWRGPNGALQTPPIDYIDIEAHPSPSFNGPQWAVPYESMRGCPFTCKFCSFPSASPKWRFKSAKKILADWAAYAEKNNAEVIKSYDSTFTIPPPRFRELLAELPALNLPWEAYSRANVLGSAEVVDQLEAAHCLKLFIGFESMNPVALKNMDKKVTVEQNARAIEALRGSNLEVRGSFMVGYPGETPEGYAHTHRFLVEDYRGPFNVHFFMFSDETMPVWQDAGKYALEVTDGFTWKHQGMDSDTAIQLRAKTLFDVRWHNDNAVHDAWQLAYVRPLIPGVSLPASVKVEKRVEQLAFLVKDLGENDASAARCRQILSDLERQGVDLN
jgi:hypothetical protein